jgi:pimeloyl-ACP methyl ester carboxylesterase
VATFLLVHGGQHGAWCWVFVEMGLQHAGHNAIAVDLPIEDETAGVAQYAQLAAAAAQGVDGPVIVVGHSLGGLTIPLIPALRPVSRLVFVCAAYPEPGRSHFEALAAEPSAIVGEMSRAHLDDPAPTSHLSTPDMARSAFYHDVPGELQAWAIRRLRRQSRTPHREVTPLQAWPSTPRTLIHAADDPAIPLHLARRRTMSLFGEEPVVIPGGHSPFLSRPNELVALLSAIADD